MKFLFLFIGLGLGILSIFQIIKILVEQYYSFYRLCQIFFIDIKNNIKESLYICLFITAGILMLCYKMTYLASLCFLLSWYALLPNISLKKYSFTRRNIFLLSISIIFYLTMSICCFIYLNYIMFSLLNFALILCALLLSSFILYPMEISIRHYYILKARKKILSKKRILIGITGSFGKTTTKNLIFSLLNVRFLMSEQNHNYNTLMGLAKYINNEVGDDEVILVELGVDHRNSMKKFHKLFSLDYAIITSIGEMHLSTFHSLKNIAKEKISIKSLLKPTGTLIINEEILQKYSDLINIPYLSYSHSSFKFTNNGDLLYKEKKIKTPLLTDYQFDALACALLVSKELNLTNEEVEYGLNHLKLPSRRLNVIKKEYCTIIDDSYNANLRGVISALTLLKKCSGKKIVVTGGLIELKNKFDKYNRLIAQEMLFCDKVIFLSSTKKHPFYDEFVTMGVEDKVILMNYQQSIEFINKCVNNETILLLAKGNDHFLK